MRKFVSAITSLAIAATALSGTMMFSASAADTTIFEFRSGDSNSVSVSAEEIAAGSVKVPVTLYVPASSGFNTASLKMAINGAETIGQYAGETVNGVEHTEHHFGNYGIIMEDYVTGDNGYKGFCDPCALDGGEVTGEMGAGYAPWCSPSFVASSYNMNYQHTDAVMDDKNVDAYGAFAADGTSGVTTWDETASWAYEYGLIEFNLVLPQNLAEGTYTLDVFKDKYVNLVSIGMAELVYGQSAVTGVDGAVAWESRALTITVGEGGDVQDTTTTTTTTTTTDTDPVDPPVGDGVVLTFDTVTVEPGAEATVNLTITGDPGTAGASLYFTYDSALTLGSVKAGNAYRVSAIINDNMDTTDGTTKAVAYTWGKDSELKAADGAKVLTFTFTAPTEPGTYPVDLLYDLDLVYDGQNEKFNEMANLDGVNHDLTVVAGAVIVEGDAPDTTTTESTTTTTSTTPVPGDGVVLTFDTVTVAPGAEATVNLTITGDPGTAGASLYFTYDSALTLGSVKAGNAYRVSAIINDNMDTTDGTTKAVAYTWGKDSELKAADGAKVLTFTFTAPTEPGTYPVDLLYDLDLVYDGQNEKFNEMANLDGVNHALTVVAGAVVVEGETTTTESTTTETTTTETTTTETTTSSTTPQPGDIFWGDVDCDQDVDIADVVRLNKFNAGNADVSEQGQLNADCEFDGKLDADDALAIKKYLAHLIPYEDLGDQ